MVVLWTDVVVVGSCVYYFLPSTSRARGIRTQRASDQGALSCCASNQTRSQTARTSTIVTLPALAILRYSSSRVAEPPVDSLPFSIELLSAVFGHLPSRIKEVSCPWCRLTSLADEVPELATRALFNAVSCCSSTLTLTQSI